MQFFVPVKTTNDLNTRQHWRHVWSRGKKQRAAAREIAQQLGDKPELPCVVTLTRVSRGEMDDDNAVGALKHVRDGIADWLGVDDKRRDVVRYRYAQRKGQPAGVEVSIAPMQQGSVG